jgi:hypothetical protein
MNVRSLPLERSADRHRRKAEKSKTKENRKARVAIPRGTRGSKRRRRHAVNRPLAAIGEQRARYYYHGCTL